MAARARFLKGITPDNSIPGRKVRALKGRMPGNARRRHVKAWLQRQCNRKYTARDINSIFKPGKGEMASQELTGSLATGWPGKPHPKQGQIGKIWGGPPFFRVRPLEVNGNICPRWMATAGYCHLWQYLVQNSAYRLTPILKILKKCVLKEQILVLKTPKLSTKVVFLIGASLVVFRRKIK